jgi:hypothetical protein
MLAFWSRAFSTRSPEATPRSSDSGIGQERTSNHGAVTKALDRLEQLKKMQAVLIAKLDINTLDQSTRRRLLLLQTQLSAEQSEAMLFCAASW